jgi:hypothetical protein
MVGKPSMTAAVARTNSADCGCRVVSEMLCSSRIFAFSWMPVQAVNVSPARPRAL